VTVGKIPENEDKPLRAKPHCAKVHQQERPKVTAKKIPNNIDINKPSEESW
jgi:hypothetical protein